MSDDSKEEKWYSKKAKELIFMTCVGGISIAGGFSYALSLSRKQDQKAFDQGLADAARLHDAGSTLAWRALKWGTFFACSGFTVFMLAVWKVSGANNMAEFREVAGRKLPVIPKRPIEEQDRNEFKNVREFVQYYIDKDEQQKKDKEVACEMKREKEKVELNTQDKSKT